MKQYLLFLVPAVILTACGIGTRTQSAQLPAPSEEVCIHLALCVPDHEMLPQARPFFTDEYLTAWDNAIMMPDKDEYLGYISQAEWIYYFVSGNGDCDDLQAHIIHVDQQDSIALVTLCYTCLSEDPAQAEQHTLSLRYMNDNWLITDFDDTKQRMQDWVRSEVDSFRSGRDWCQVFINENNKEDMLRYDHDMTAFITARFQDPE